MYAVFNGDAFNSRETNVETRLARLEADLNERLNRKNILTVINNWFAGLFSSNPKPKPKPVPRYCDLSFGSKPEPRTLKFVEPAPVITGVHPVRRVPSSAPKELCQKCKSKNITVSRGHNELHFTYCHECKSMYTIPQSFDF